MKSKSLLIALLTFVVAGLTGCLTLKPIVQNTYEKVIDAEGNTQDELYIKAHEWFVKQFTSAKSVIQFQDKESGKIMGKYVAELTRAESASYYFESTQIISLDVRDGKVRLIISDPCVAVGTKNAYGQRFSLGACNTSATEQAQAALVQSWNDLARSLEQYLNTDNDW